MTVQDRVEGILVGLAAGDRNSGPIRMALRLAESLVALERFDRADVQPPPCSLHQRHRY